MAFGSNDSILMEMVISARDEASERVRGLGEELRRIGEIAGGVVLGDMMFRGLDDAVNSLRDFGTNLIDVNARAEQLTNSLTSIYQSATEAAKAMAFMMDNALHNPYTLTAIREAGTKLAASGSDITSALPAIENAAARSGASLAVATQAYVDAKEGLYRMLGRDLYIQKSQLVPYGLKEDATGHVDPTTFESAFAKFEAAKDKGSPDGLTATQRQMQTFTGMMSNLQDQWLNFESIAGKGIFSIIKRDLADFLSYLYLHKQEVADFAFQVGQVLGEAAMDAGRAFHWLMDNVPHALAVVQDAWNRVSGVVGTVAGFINSAVQGVGTYLRATVLPGIEEALGTLLLFWQSHGKAIGDELGVMGSNIGRFLSWVGQNLGAYFEMFKGEAEMGWGLIQGVFGGALDLLTGNFNNFGKDFNEGWHHILEGAAQIIEGGAAVMIRVLGAAFTAINDMEHKLYTSGQSIFQGLFDLFASLEEPMIRLVHGITQPIYDSINQIMHTMHDISTSAVGQFAGMPAMGWDSHTSIAQKSADQAIKDIHKVAGTDTHPLGWAPNQGITFNEDKALAALHKQALSIFGDISKDAPSAFKSTPAAAKKAGEDALTAWLEGFNSLGAGGLHLAAGPHYKGPLGGLPGLGGLPVPGFEGATDPKTAKSDAARLLKDAHDQFTIDMAQHFDDKMLLKGDISTIIKDMTGVLGFDAKDRTLEQINLLKQIEGHAKTAVAHLAGPNRFSGSPGQFRQAGYGSTDVVLGMFGEGGAMAALQAQLRAALSQLEQQREQNRLLQQVVDLMRRPGDSVHGVMRARGLPVPSL